jgi:hypothetical protein
MRHEADVIDKGEITCPPCLDGSCATQRQSTLPDPNVKGPCQAQAHWTCTGQAAGERLNPLAMLPGSTVSSEYVLICQPCYDHLADSYVATLHGRPS